MSQAHAGHTILSATNDMMRRRAFLDMRWDHQGSSLGVLGRSVADTQEKSIAVSPGRLSPWEQ
jgi:hypothetical protein